MCCKIGHVNNDNNNNINNSTDIDAGRYYRFRHERVY